MAGMKFDKKKLEYYKRNLLKLKESFVNDINNMSKNPGSKNGDSGDVSGHVLHMADVATDMYDREFNLGLASNEREVLQQIEQALKRIEDKSFGSCLECDKAIPTVRLNAIPYVETCLKCQEKIETRR
jgi:RNA polymerase-binding protein DksA